MHQGSQIHCGQTHVHVLAHGGDSVNVATYRAPLISIQTTISTHR